MKTFLQRFMCLLAFLALSVVYVGPVHGLTVNTTTDVPDLRGQEISLTLTLVASGVGQETETPLGTSTVNVGESVDLGTLSDTPSRPAQLRVTLSDGRFYRTVRPRELRAGTIDLMIHPRGPTEGLEIQEHSVLVQPFPNRMMIREVIVFRNPNSHRVGGEGDPITIDLPDEAGRFNPGPGFGGEADYSMADGRLNYHVQLAPGRSIIGFYYLVEPGGDRYEMVRRPEWPTGRFNLNTMSADNVSITASGLQSVSGRQSGQAPRGTKQFMARSLSPGDTVSVTWSGLSDMSPPGGMPGQGPPGMEGGTSPSRTESDPARDSRPSALSQVSWPVFLGIGISLLVFAGSYGYVQFYLKNREGGAGEQFLVEEIARLDQEYEDGAIDEAYYKRTRRRWKSRAEDLYGDVGED